MGPGEERGGTAGGDCVPRLWETGRQGQADVFGLNLAVIGEALSRNRHAGPDRALFFLQRVTPRTWRNMEKDDRGTLNKAATG